MIPEHQKPHPAKPPIFIFGAGILGLSSIAAAVTRFFFAQREEREPAPKDDPKNPEHPVESEDQEPPPEL